MIIILHRLIRKATFLRAMANKQHANEASIVYLKELALNLGNFDFYRVHGIN
jgi:hypothetical protein